MPPLRKALCGTVISSGKMAKAVKVRISQQVYHKFLKKYFKTHRDFLASDPTQSTRTGDVVRISDMGPVSKSIRLTVTEIITPWGPAIEKRPALPGDILRRAQGSGQSVGQDEIALPSHSTPKKTVAR